MSARPVSTVVKRTRLPSTRRPRVADPPVGLDQASALAGSTPPEGFSAPCATPPVSETARLPPARLILDLCSGADAPVTSALSNLQWTRCRARNSPETSLLLRFGWHGWCRTSDSVCRLFSSSPPTGWSSGCPLSRAAAWPGQPVPVTIRGTSKVRFDML